MQEPLWEPQPAFDHARMETMDFLKKKTKYKLSSISHCKQTLNVSLCLTIFLKYFPALSGLSDNLSILQIYATL